ncbi:uncharacterized protein LOC126847019 isoform X2 [Adelges cooleyi]|nr:uncharacterized protein LOC126847019 isoform X2 [Adelges cooleyi]
MIKKLSSDQKCTLIKYVLDEFEYDTIIDFLYPPDELLLTNKSEDDAIYSIIKENEVAIQRRVTEIIGSDQEINLESMSSYDTEVAKRGKLLNVIFRNILNVKMRHSQMCVNGESYKCKLVGLIKRTVEYRMINVPRCSDDNTGTCFITPTGWLTSGVPIKFSFRPKELYQDRQCGIRSLYFETLLYDRVNLVKWHCTVPPRDEYSDE